MKTFYSIKLTQSIAYFQILFILEGGEDKFYVGILEYILIWWLISYGIPKVITPV